MGALTLEHVAMEARPYPAELLKGCETGLCLFSAAFNGWNDAVHFALADVRTTCVDRDPDKLEEMCDLYPVDWEFVQADVFEFAEKANRKWDAVSVDPWTVDFQVCADRVGLWCSLASRAVTLGSGAKTVVEAPSGWKISERIERSSFRGGVFWTVLVPE